MEARNGGEQGKAGGGRRGEGGKGGGEGGEDGVRGRKKTQRREGWETEREGMGGWFWHFSKAWRPGSPWPSGWSFPEKTEQAGALGRAAGSAVGREAVPTVVLQDWNKTVLFWFLCCVLGFWGRVGGPEPEGNGNGPAFLHYFCQQGLMEPDGMEPR